MTSLSPRQEEAWKLKQEGLAVKDIAAKMGISVNRAAQLVRFAAGKLGTSLHQTTSKPARLSELRCELCGERITQHAVNNGERRFCSLEHAIQGGELGDPWGVWGGTASRESVVPDDPAVRICENPDCDQRVKYPRRYCDDRCRRAALQARATGVVG